MLLLALVIISPTTGLAKTKHHSKTRTTATKRASSSLSIKWIGDIPDPKTLLNAWENNAISSDFDKLCKALLKNGYHESEDGYCKPGIACLSFTGGRMEFDVIVTIPDSALRQQYFEVAKKAFKGKKNIMIDLNGDEIFIANLLL